MSIENVEKLVDGGSFINATTRLNSLHSGRRTGIATDGGGCVIDKTLIGCLAFTLTDKATYVWVAGLFGQKLPVYGKN